MMIKSKSEYIKITQSDAVKNGEDFVLIDFYTSWCGPCMGQARILKEGKDILTKLFPTLTIYSIDCERNDLFEVTDKLNIMSIPQLIVYDGGIERMEVGTQNLVNIVKFLDIIIDNQKDKEAIKKFLEKNECVLRETP